MASLLADENFPHSAVLVLRRLGHNVLTATEAGLANKRIPDEIVLEYATRLDRAVVTYNWDDFARLHDQYPAHAGIIVCAVDPDSDSLSARIDQNIRVAGDLAGKILQIPR